MSEDGKQAAPEVAPSAQVKKPADEPKTTAEAQDEALETKESDKPTAQDLRDVLADLEESKQGYVEMQADANKTLDNLAKKLYLGEKKQLAAKELLLDRIVARESDTKKLWDNLRKSGCKFIGVEGGEIRFYKNGNFKPENELPGDRIKITTQEKTVQTTETPEQAEARAKEEEAKKAAAIDDFKKTFPGIAEDSTSTIATQPCAFTVGQITPGKDFKIYTHKQTEVVTAAELGTAKRMTRITKPYKISVKEPTGIREFVYVEGLVRTADKQHKFFEGWVAFNDLTPVTDPYEIEEAEAQKLAVKVDEKGLARQRVEKSETEEAQKRRGVFVDENDYVHFKDDKEFRATTLSTIFPTAIKGDRVQVTPARGGHTVTAEYTGRDWVDKKTGLHVPIYNKDRVILDKVNEYSEQAPRSTDLLAGESLLEEKPQRLSDRELAKTHDGKLGWRDVWRSIAESTMEDEKYKEKFKDRSLTVDEYAKILQRSADVNGYYWLILPPKKTTAEQAAVKASEKIVAMQTAAQKGDKAAAAERTKRAKNFYNAEKDKIWHDEKYYISKELNELVENENRWKDAWEAGYPINSELIKAAFEFPPLDKVPKQKIRNGVREMIKKGIFKKNGFDFSDLLEYFNNNGELYRTVDKGFKATKASQIREDYDFLEKIKTKQARGEVLSAKEGANAQYIEPKQKEIMQILFATAQLFDALQNSYVTASGKPQLEHQSFKVGNETPEMKTLNDIFPPSDEGALNGNKQAMNDLDAEQGVRIAGGGVFTGGLFKYDFRDRVKGISRFDMTTSNASANAMIWNRCLDRDEKGRGKLNPKKLETELNKLLGTGVAALLIDLNVNENKKEVAETMSKLGITAADREKETIIPELAEKLKIDISQGKELTAMQKDLIHLGLLLELAGNQTEVKNDPSEQPLEWSNDPNIRALQEQAKGLNPKLTGQDIKNIEKEFNQQIVLLLHMKIEKNFKGIEEAGLTFPLPIAGNETTKLYGALSPSYDFSQNKVNLRAGVGVSHELHKNITALAGAGVGTGPSAYAGAGISFEIPMQPGDTWKENVTLGAFASIDLADLSKTSLSVGLALHSQRQLGAEYLQNLEKKLKAAGYEAVDKETDVHKKAQLLRNLPGPHGVALKQASNYLKWSDQQLVDVYETYIKPQLAQQTAQSVLAEDKFLGFLPPVMGVGVGFGIGLKPGGPTFLFGAEGAISIGSELVVFQRARSSTEQMIRSGDAEMNQQAADAIRESERANFEREAKNAGYEKVIFKDDTVVGDSSTGMRPVRTETGSAVSKPAKSTEKTALDAAFEDLNKQLNAQGMSLEKVGDLYKLNVDTLMAEGRERGNFKLYVDPQMSKKNGVFIKPNADPNLSPEIYISANKNPELVIKRSDIIYPRVHEGNIKHTLITISDNDFRTQEAIKAESDYYLESRTTYNSGEQWTKLSRKTLDAKRQNKQANLLEWKEGEKYEFETLATSNEQLDKYNAERSQADKLSELGQKAREAVGTAQIEKVDANSMLEKAKEFMKDPKYKTLYRQYTTFGLRTQPDLAKLDKAIVEKFGQLTPDQMIVLKEEMFNLSMSERGTLTVNQKQERQRQHLDWLRDAIYVPYFKQRLDASDKPNGNNPHNYTAEQVAEAYVAPLRTIDMTNKPIPLPIGARIDVAVGTQNILGTRGVIITGTNIENHAMYEGKNYAPALLSGRPPMDKTIALILRESQRPLEKITDDEFMKSPWAMKLFLLGSKEGSPILAKLLGPEDYEHLIKCFSTQPPHIESDAIKGLTYMRELAKKLSDAQEGKGGTTIRVDGLEYESIEEKGIRIGVRTASLKSGTYQRCLNGANIYHDEMVAVQESEKFDLLPGNIRSYSTRRTTTLVSTMAQRSINIGFGVMGEVAPEPPPPPPIIPPGPKPPPPPEVKNEGGVHNVAGEGPKPHDTVGPSTGSGPGLGGPTPSTPPPGPGQTPPPPPPQPPPPGPGF